MAAYTNPSISGAQAAKTDFVLSQSGTGVGVAPTGTVGANGAVTLGTALPATFSSGLFLYYPAGALFSGSSAGFYWTVMSSTTVGTAYSTTYSGSGAPVIPASTTAIVDAGPGAFTGATGAKNAITITVPGKLIGRNGQMELNVEVSYPNNANTKTYTVVFAAQTLQSFARTTTSHDRFTSRYTSDGSETRGTWYATSEHSAAGTVSQTVSNIDTTTAQDFTLTLNTSVATDFMIIQSYQIKLSQ